MHRLSAAAPVALSIAALLVSGGMIGAAQAAPAPGPVPVSPSPAVSLAPSSSDAVRYTFDGRAPLADASGHGYHLSPVSRYGGAFSLVAHGGGRALAFPPPCVREPCPRIALRAPTATGLNPGRRSLRYGAAVKLGADQTTKGENVLQKGYSAHGSQYKLQIDGVAGRPSCVLVGDSVRPRIHLAISSVSVADNRWHTLECRRAADRLSVWVDGRIRGATTIPADLSVNNRTPFSVGGKGSFADNDQFQGLLDEVWVVIGA